MDRCSHKCSFDSALSLVDQQHHPEPPSREDALAKRLRTLRNQREKAEEEEAGEEAASGTSTSTRQQHTKEDDPPTPPPPYTEEEPTTGRPTAQPQPQPTPPLPPSHLVHPITTKPLPPEGTTTHQASSSSHHPPQAQRGIPDAGLADNADDDKALDAILDTLVLEDDHQWSASSSSSDDDGNGEGSGSAQQVRDLLSNLTSATGNQGDHAAHEDGGGGGHDNGESSSLSREEEEVDRILARALDELNLTTTTTTTNLETNPPSTTTTTTTTNDPEPELSLPSVPQDDSEDNSNTTLPDLPATPQSLKDTPTTDLSLPQVPTALRDPVPPSSQQDQDPFESSIANRLAALRGPGHTPLATDAFGLPSAPTSQPEDVKGGLLRPRSGYTDADQKTWCCVCLDDGTIRCLDCEDGGEVYCARCWREMHIGPAAGYDERGHQWEKFDPRQK